MEALNTRLEHMERNLVSRPEFDRHKWELEQHKKDTEREINSLREEIESKSVAKLWTRITTFAAGLSGVIALILTLWGLQKQ